MDVNPIEEGYLPEYVQDWIQQVADQHFDGRWGQAAAVILEAAYERNRQPDNKWAELDALSRLRGKGR